MSNWRSNFSELKNAIIDNIDTGNNRNDIVEQVSKELPQYTKEEINAEIFQMTKDWIIIDRGGGHYTVTAWSRDGVMELTKALTFQEGLQILADKGIYHYEMRKGSCYSVNNQK